MDQSAAWRSHDFRQRRQAELMASCESSALKSLAMTNFRKVDSCSPSAKGYGLTDMYAKSHRFDKSYIDNYHYQYSEICRRFRDILFMW
jgi:hypothetical protein